MTNLAGMRLSGPLLSVVRRLASVGGASTLLRTMALETLGIRALAGLPETYRGELPDSLRPVQARAPRRWDARPTPADGRGDWPHTTEDYLAAYRAGRDPRIVVEKALDAFHALGRRTPSMNVMGAIDFEAVRRDAAVAARRHRDGCARPLEGVPFVVKDQHDVAGLPTAIGSSHVPPPATRDGTMVARLRAAGAIVLGKSVMTEWGISPIGTSVHAMLPRNPHDAQCIAGGSSTGSAVALAMGIGPFATGGDAGGSVRVPAGVNGVFGLKPTFGRISRVGEAFAGSLNHVGLLAVSSNDLARLLEVIAADVDEDDPMTSWAPAAHGFGRRLRDGTVGLSIGIDEREWSAADDEVAQPCMSALRALERLGASLVPIRIPLAPHAPAIGIVTVGCEGVAVAKTAEPLQRERLAPDAQLAMSVASGVSAGEYLDAQRLRAGLRTQVAAALRRVDVIATPTLPIPTPRLPERDTRRSFSDASLVLSLCRYAMIANLTGLPAISIPVGVDRPGNPVGLQLLGDAWDEASLLAVTATLEREAVAEIRRPPGAVDLLSPS